MALRRVLVTVLLGLAGGAFAQVKRFPLEDRAAYLVAIGTEAPTTVVFPGAITALDAANLGVKPEDNPPVLLAHTPGAAFFTVRAVRPNAHAAVNVLFRGRAYALTFATGESVDRTVTFTEQVPEFGQKEVRLTPARWLNLLDRARAFPALEQQYPVLAQAIGRASPGVVTEGEGFRAVLEEVLRFEPEDTLVFRVRLENAGRSVVRYHADRINMRVGDESFPVALSDASGEIPPGRATQVYLAVTGAPDGSRAALSVHNRFAVQITRAP